MFACRSPGSSNISSACHAMPNDRHSSAQRSCADYGFIKRSIQHRALPVFRVFIFSKRLENHPCTPSYIKSKKQVVCIYTKTRSVNVWTHNSFAKFATSSSKSTHCAFFYTSEIKPSMNGTIRERGTSCFSLCLPTGSKQTKENKRKQKPFTMFTGYSLCLPPT